jgi:hypothetical protein
MVKGRLVCKHTALVPKEYNFRRRHENTGVSKRTQFTEISCWWICSNEAPYIVKRNVFAHKSTKETRLQQNIISERRMYFAKARQLADSEITKHSHHLSVSRNVAKNPRT